MKRKREPQFSLQEGFGFAFALFPVFFILHQNGKELFELDMDQSRSSVQGRKRRFPRYFALDLSMLVEVEGKRWYRHSKPHAFGIIVHHISLTYSLKCQKVRDLRVIM
jgi:hypothetical protein